MYEVINKIIEISKYIDDWMLLLYKFIINTTKCLFVADAIIPKLNIVIIAIKRKRGNSPYNNSDNDFKIWFFIKCGKEESNKNNETNTKLVASGETKNKNILNSMLFGLLKIANKFEIKKAEQYKNEKIISLINIQKAIVFLFTGNKK